MIFKKQTCNVFVFNDKQRRFIGICLKLHLVKGEADNYSDILVTKYVNRITNKMDFYSVSVTGYRFVMKAILHIMYFWFMDEYGMKKAKRLLNAAEVDDGNNRNELD